MKKLDGQRPESDDNRDGGKQGKAEGRGERARRKKEVKGRKSLKKVLQYG